MEIHPDDHNTLLRRIEDLEDLLSVYDAHADGRSIPWDEVKHAAGFRND